MLKIVETFAGIGAQRQALENTKIEFEISTTVEWEIGAIIAYHLMHHTTEITEQSKNMTKEELIDILKNYTLSNNGKEVIKEKSLKLFTVEKLRFLYDAINHSSKTHYTDITKLNGTNLPTIFDVLTYSFPCQDLSLGSSFHNINNNGIKKNGGTRSGLLWEIERILDERVSQDLDLPKFLLMENVMQVFANNHRENFESWLEKLEKLGYYNHFSYEDSEKMWKLDASEFGLPQRRKRAFMLSVKIDGNRKLKEEIESYLLYTNNLTRKNIRVQNNIKDYVFLNKYYDEQKLVHPRYTRSRMKIHGVIIEKTKKYNSIGNPILVKYNHDTGKETFTGATARTITTKQDRNPNAGLVETKWGYENNRPFRYLTQRECFGLMGFPNKKFDRIKNAEIKGLSGEKTYKLAGNSICVPVLEEIFLAIDYIDKEILGGEKQRSQVSTGRV